MKNIFLLSILFVLFFFNLGIAQTLDGGCDKVTVTSTPSYAPNLYFSNVYTAPCGGLGQTSCCLILLIGGPSTPKYYLEKKNGTSWLPEAGPQSSAVFSGLANGTYRVRMNVPVIEYSNCSGEATSMFNTLGQFMGWWGRWSGDYLTNEALVGKTTPADISYFFVDGDGNNSNPFGFDFGEIVKMDASASKNYNLWWLSIAEQAGQQRYHSNGWTSGTFVSPFNLTDFWAQNAFTFENLNSYKVQFAVENDKCINSSWNNLPQAFFICPAGSGCREGSDFEKKIAISPNPAQSWVHLANFEAFDEQEYQLAIFDLTGRAVKKITRWSNEDVDVSDLPNGMYSLTLWNAGKRIFSDKLIVNQ